ncbi:hypothetical protein BGZ50_002874 [Haplosporangium sp. Z 11]|nr:hypothetical protein BGZ50_002874 [Haplosporangium sp. Z 11]
MNKPITLFVIILGLGLTALFPSENPSRLESVSPLLLGFLLGLIVAETPIASPIQELLGLQTRHPDKVGLQLLHDSSPLHGEQGGSETVAGQTSSNTKVSSSSSSSSNGDDKKLDQKTMYGLQHAFLNLEVTGWWFNMGLWEKDDDTDVKDENGSAVKMKSMRFQDACKALVRKVTSQLDINQESHILDVGFGCGDQDVYIAQLYEPARITGITIEPIQHHAAENLIRRTTLPSETVIDLHVADASNLPEFLDTTPSVFQYPAGSSLSSSTSTHNGTFSHVLSIDSAYHYNTRATFLKNASQVLTPDTGRLAMADMLLARPPPTSRFGQLLFQAVFSGMQVPVENMKTMSEYKQDLIDAGFVDIEIECIEDRVFPGLAGFIQEQRYRFAGMVSPGVMWTYGFLSWGLSWLDRSHWLHFVVVKARNGPRHPSSS